MAWNKRLCPFIEELYDECYSTNMDSRKVEEAIFYCGGNYEECEMYKELLLIRSSELVTMGKRKIA